jgi:S1 RNA binding domain protein
MQFEVGSIVEGKIVSVTKFGAFVELADGKTGMVHISEVSNTYVADISEHVKVGQQVKVKVLSIGEDSKISLSIKKALPQEERVQKKRSAAVYVDYSGSNRKKEPMSFEDMMAKFKQSSDEKMSDLKKSIGNKQRGYSRRSSSRSI